MAYQTHQYQGMLAETVSIPGHGHDQGQYINAYFARPLGAGPVAGVVLLHHMPGWDEWYLEATRKFAQQGFAALTPNLYFRDGNGTPEDIAAKVRAGGGVPDEQVIGDIEAAANWLRAQTFVNGKVGGFGTCSGGRHVYLVACRSKCLDAAVDCWGGRVVMAPKDLTAKQPVSPLDYTSTLSCPLLGIFGANDESPSLEQVAHHEAALKQHNKTYEFHIYPDAGHGFFYHDRAAYRQAQAVDGWAKVFDFLNRKLH